MPNSHPRPSSGPGGDHNHTASFTGHAQTETFDVQPSYIDTVYVIRVK